MKTQIILRIVLLVIALFVFTDNNGGNKSVRTHAAALRSTGNTSSEAISKTDNKNTQHDDNTNKEIPAPYVPDRHHDHDFDCFDFKHHEKRLFWKCLANRAFAFLYHATVLCALMAELLIH